jgi:hypothetical protein
MRLLCDDDRTGQDPFNFIQCSEVLGGRVTRSGSGGAVVPLSFRLVWYLTGAPMPDTGAVAQWVGLVAVRHQRGRV